jgi:hypothetical protein
VSGSPRYVVVSLAGDDDAEIVRQGRTAAEAFTQLFLEPYVIEGERYHPGENAVLHGVLLATREASVVTVPIWTWTGQDGAPRFLCQASDDGSPPAISVFATSAGELLDQLEARLAEPG